MDNVTTSLKGQGGLAQIVQCETHLRVRTDEGFKTPKITGPQKRGYVPGGQG